MERLVEVVPNFSEGRRREVVDQIVQAILSVPGTTLLDLEMDPDHNRSVVTFVAPPEAAVEAAFRGIQKAAELIDLNQHQGQHPRIGATDVVPFVPLKGVSMEECVALAEELGRRVAEELKIPVYLYEEAARVPERKNLANIRKGEFEGLREAIKTDPSRKPDFGPAELHPTAGATVIGARKILIAYNVNLGTQDLAIAKKIARRVRARGGGLAFVKALGFELKERGLVQVSMNLVDYKKTPIFAAYELVKLYAERYGVPVVGSEIVGLVPQEALVQVADFYLRLENFQPDQIIEARLAKADPLSQYLGALASSDPTPGGGAASALSLAQAYALLLMVSRLTLKSKKLQEHHAAVQPLLDPLTRGFQRAQALIHEDTEAFNQVMAAFRMPKTTDEEKQARREAIQKALKRAAEVPLETMQQALQTLEPAAVLLDHGNPNALSDVGVALQQARAALLGAELNVRINLASIKDEAFKAETTRQLETIKETWNRREPELQQKLLERLGV